MTVIYSTNHSLEVIKEAQETGLSEFNLVICDEAHRTTEVTLDDKISKNSVFVKIYDENYIKAKNRLNMIATPRIYSAYSKRKASDSNVTIYSLWTTNKS